MNAAIINAALVRQVRQLHRAAMIALAIVAVVASIGVGLVSGKQQWLLHTRNVLRVLNSAEREVEHVVYEGDLVDGRLIGGDHALALFDSVATLTADNPEQVARIVAARAAAAARIDAASAVRVRQPSARLDFPERRKLADAVNAARDVEQRLYDERNASMKFWRFVMYGVVMVGLGLLAVALQRFQRTVMSEAEDAAEARAHLDLLEERLAFVLQRAPFAVAIVRPDGSAEVSNPLWQQLVGNESLVPNASTHPVARALSSLQATVRSSNALEIDEFTIPSDHGDSAVWTATAYPLESAGRVDHDLVGMVLVEVSQHRALEARLRHSQRLESIGRLAGGVAHDFNNILTAILGFAEMVGNGVPAKSRARDDLTQVTRAAERASVLTRQLLAFSRQQVVNPAVLDASEVVRAIEPMLRRLIGSHIKVHVESDQPLWSIRADRGQLEQIVVNLALNARDAMMNGGDLVITTHNVQRDDGHRYVALTVRDSGEGIPEANRARIFEPYFTTKGPGQGTGLGLATVQSIAHQSGATIAVESADGRGTRFTVVFPFVEGPAETAAASAPVQITSRHASVVVVDDDRDVRHLMEYVLTEAGHSVVTFSNGADALAHLRRAAIVPDLVVSDLVMPGVGGAELERQVAADGRRVPFLFVSGYVPEAHNALTTRSDQHQLLAKPFTSSELLAAVAARLAMA